MLLQDIWLPEKLTDFDREVISERRMQAKGSGAYETFTVTGDIGRFSTSKLFSDIGKTTPVVARFSTVAREMASGARTECAVVSAEEALRRHADLARRRHLFRIERATRSKGEDGVPRISSYMDAPVHIAITRKVMPSKVIEFERALADFASRSLVEHGARGVLLLYPPVGSQSTEYGILRSFANVVDRDAFYDSALYKEWLERIETMVEGAPSYRHLDGLEAWFRSPSGTHEPPPRWKMAILTWLAVWPVSMAVGAVVGRVVGRHLPGFLTAGVVAAGIVLVLTWGAMPALVKVAGGWLHEAPRPSRRS